MSTPIREASAKLHLQDKSETQTAGHSNDASAASSFVLHDGKSSSEEPKLAKLIDPLPQPHRKGFNRGISVEMLKSRERSVGHFYILQMSELEGGGNLFVTFSKIDEKSCNKLLSWNQWSVYLADRAKKMWTHELIKFWRFEFGCYKKLLKENVKKIDCW